MKFAFAALLGACVLFGAVSAQAATWRIEASGSITSLSSRFGTAVPLPFAVGDDVSVAFTLTDDFDPTRVTSFTTTSGLNITYGGTISDLTTTWGSYTATRRPPTAGTSETRLDYAQVQDDYIPAALPGNAATDGSRLDQLLTGADVAGQTPYLFSLSMTGAPTATHGDALPTGDKFTQRVLDASTSARMSLSFREPNSSFGAFGAASLDTISATLLPDQPTPIPLPPAVAMLGLGLAALGAVGRRRRC